MKKQIIFDFYNTLYNPKTEKIFWGGFALLKNLSKQYSLVLITTGSKDRANQLQNFSGIKYFTKVILCKKKTFSMYRKLIKRPYLTIIIGDRPEEEIAFGKILNTRTLLVKSSVENPVISIKRFLKESP